MARRKIKIKNTFRANTRIDKVWFDNVLKNNADTLEVYIKEQGKYDDGKEFITVKILV